MTDATTTLTLTAGMKCYPSVRKGKWVRLVRALDLGNIPGNVFYRAFAKSALFKKIKRRERRTLDPQVARTSRAEA
jgi:hypothetical protein